LLVFEGGVVKSTLWISVSCLAATLLALPAQAAEGVLIVEKTTVNGAAQTSQIQIERTRMRAEVAGVGQSKRTAIFDGNQQVLRLLDMDKKTYNELTKADVDRLGGQLQDAMAQMQAQLANMPPAQRAQIEAMMRGRGLGAAPPPKTEYKKTGTDKVGKWSCDKYDGYQNNQKVAEICTVDPSVLGFSMTDFEVSRQLVDFFKKLTPQASDQVFTIGKVEDQGFAGVPVRRISTVAGRETTTELQEVTRQTFPDSLFELPAGFQKEDFPAGAGRGGRGR
jgi:hypothetical protein